jgi:hypothetical protein
LVEKRRLGHHDVLDSLASHGLGKEAYVPDLEAGNMLAKAGHIRAWPSPVNQSRPRRTIRKTPPSADFSYSFVTCSCR